jgi:Uma2 family endonuclease
MSPAGEGCGRACRSRASRFASSPDWLCEILSPTTRGYDVLKKRPFYARIGVSWLWYVDVDARTVTVSRLADGVWVEVAIHGEDQVVRLEPFLEVELDLTDWWASESETGG